MSQKLCLPRVISTVVLLCALAPFSRAKPPALDHQAFSQPPPNIIRTCCAFGADLSVARIPFVRKSDITSVDLLGEHKYLGDKFEGNGIIYTQRGGFIDLGHLRDYVDWTAYLYVRMQQARVEDCPVFLDLGSEGGHKVLSIYPESVGSERELAELAGKIAFDLSTWHEIATWFGASYIPLVPERYSSFSPEDLYSNLLGVRVGIEALGSDLPFDEAVTQILDRHLVELQAVTTVEDTHLALGQVEEIWWTRRKALPSAKVLLRRNTTAQVYLEPWLIPTEPEQTEAPVILELPAASLNQYYELAIKTNAKIGLRRIMPERESEVVTQLDFVVLLDYIAGHQLLAAAPPTRRRAER